MKNFELIIFDWDGTLMDSTALIASCVQNAFADLGLPVPSVDAARNTIGLGLHEAVQMLKPDVNADETQSIANAYRVHFLKSSQGKDDLFDGVTDTLMQLSDDDFKLAVATGKSRRGLAKMLKATDLEQFFDASRCADEARSKPHPLMLEMILDELSIAPERSLMVGDTEYDLEMAKSLGMSSVGVSFGAHEVDRLHRHQPIAVVDKMTDLLKYV